ncbi:MAG: 30S ribosome-binding factor RbfA [Pseudomonadota bacterium]
MPREFSRTRRVGEQIQRELASLVREEIKDPRLGMVSISGVSVSRDLAHAKVYISVLGDQSAVTESLGVLKRAAGFLRHRLGQLMHIRIVPHLKFEFDSSLEEGARMDALINKAVSGARSTDDENE